MRNSIFSPARARICFLILFMFFSTCYSLRMSSHHYISVSVDENGASRFDDHAAHVNPEPNKGRETEEVGTGVYPTGSSIPDCSHACGPCFPCKRVMVSFKCSVAESCPIVYRCMCRGKYYHVPSN
ncbi:hypothetical protein AB3S75_014034 [Citrus x aurantiifolia]